MIWYNKSFDELSARQVYDMLALRAEVFVVEQEQAYQDVDYRDVRCQHILGYEGDELVAHARVFAVGGYFKDEACIGRVVVKPSYRSTGMGHILVDKAIESSIALNGDAPIGISAQLRLRKFYEAHGFVKNGTTFTEDNIAHIHMTRP